MDIGMTQKKNHVSPEHQTLKPLPFTGDVFADSCLFLPPMTAQGPGWTG